MSFSVQSKVCSNQKCNDTRQISSAFLSQAILISTKFEGSDIKYLLVKNMQKANKNNKVLALYM